MLLQLHHWMVVHKWRSRRGAGKLAGQQQAASACRSALLRSKEQEEGTVDMVAHRIGKTRTRGDVECSMYRGKMRSMRNGTRSRRVVRCMIVRAIRRAIDREL